MSERCNGWTNYETWCVKLWIDNEQGSSEYWTERAESAYRDAEACKTFTRAENARFTLAESLKTEHEESMPEVTGMWADLLGAALGSVDWHEMAESMIVDVSDDIDAEELAESSEEEEEENPEVDA